MKYTFTNDLLTGNSLIDREHRSLFDAMNRVIDAYSRGDGTEVINSTMQFMLDYVDEHFSHEEALMDGIDFPEITDHMNFHSQYKAKVRKLSARLCREGLTAETKSTAFSYINEIINHIKTDDKKIATFIEEDMR